MCTGIGILSANNNDDDTSSTSTNNNTTSAPIPQRQATATAAATAAAVELGVVLLQARNKTLGSSRYLRLWRYWSQLGIEAIRQEFVVHHLNTTTTSSSVVAPLRIAPIDVAAVPEPPFNILVPALRTPSTS